jgi:hypothetical protein
MNSITRTIRFAAFTLVEYARSGRILIDLMAGVIFFYLLLRRFDTSPLPEYFFSVTSLFTLGLSFYTASAIMGLGDRPQGYLILARRIGRGGYVIGLYLAILAIVWGIYALISLVVAFYNPVEGLDLRGWLQGTLPLLLNVALLNALLTLLAPIVLPATGRLAVLALVAIAFSGNLISGQTLAGLPAPLTTTISVLRTIFSTPLLPAFTGFALAVNRQYDLVAFAILFAQLSLTLGLLSLAVYVFSRREIIFNGA